MPRIAILFEFPTLLGGEHSLLAMIDQLRTGARGGRFEFVAIGPAEGPLAEAWRSRGFALWPSPLLDASGRKRPLEVARGEMLRLLAAGGVDLLHGNSLAMGRVTGALAESVGIPCTAHLRDILKPSRRALEDLGSNRRLFAVSDATRAFYIGLGVAPEKILTIHNGVDLERFRPRKDAVHLREKLGVPTDAFVTLTIGQIGLRKGWDTLAQALALLGQRLPKLHAVFVGERYADKPETVAYEANVRAVLDGALSRRNSWLGYRRDIPELLGAADLLVHPARQEPFGRVLLEAAASGCPILASDVGGTREMLGKAACLIPPDDPTAWAEVIQSMAGDPERRGNMARNARARIEERFSIARAADVFREALLDEIGGGASERRGTKAGYEEDLKNG